MNRWTLPVRGEEIALINPRGDAPARNNVMVTSAAAWGRVRPFPRRAIAHLSAIAALALTATLVPVSVSADEQSVELSEDPITNDDRDHWAFRPLPDVLPAEVAVPNDTWPRNDIDLFIFAKLREQGVSPSAPASRTTLIRRVFFDLVGLPPKPADVRQFISDPSVDAYEKLIDRLLASPRYGERWAQHWLDLARFAETDGFEHDKVRPTAWKYRDWVIQSLNENLPYDEFLKLQIAGDVIRPNDESARIATAFCLSGPDMPDVNSQVERKHTVLNEVTGVVGAVLLGLQVGCAQCHDHMYDPISQADFYRLRAFFAPAIHVERDKPLTTFSDAASIRPVSHLLVRGDWRREGPIVSAAYPRIANLADAHVLATRSDRRRVELAEWFVDEGQALTARVIVNRIWQYHFGRGLSNTPSDFGTMGSDPTHPLLLDWMAGEFIRSGWDLKQLHRAILTAATYRQASRHVDPDAEFVDEDPANLYLSHFPRRRLEGEIVRDAMWAVSGSLNTSMGGPGVRPPLPAELTSTLLKKQWEPSENEADHRRRSIYIFARRNLRYPLLAAFDRPAANTSCATRQESVTAPQSLWLFNSTESITAARLLAAAVQAEAGNDAQRQADVVFGRVLGRPPAADERQSVVDFLQKQRSSGQLEAESPVNHEALVDLCLALLNSNEFLYVD